jgi:diguanylate cyclase (GGDEF)-like protein
MGLPTATEGKEGRERGGTKAILLFVVLIAAAVITGALTSSLSRWRLDELAVLIVLTIAGDLLSVEAGTQFRVSGTALGVMLALTLQGPTPAMIVGVLGVAAGWIYSRERAHTLLSNLANFAWFPLLGGFFFHAMVQITHARADEAGFYLLVFATFVLTLVLNYLGAAGEWCYYQRRSLLRQTQEVLLPLLPAQLFSALLTMGAVYIAIQTGTVGIILVGLTLAIFQYLIGELLKSKHRGEELERLATTDTLTGLANRELLNRRLEDAIEEAGKTGDEFTVMLIDLDRFKEINDTLGHHYGDEVLRDLGPRLSEAAGPGGMVARLGGDEFAVISTQAIDTGAIESIAADLIDTVERGITVDELGLEVGASIGVARFPDDGIDKHTLLRHADVAMYAAKSAHTGWKFYTPELDRNSVRKLNVLSDFRRALTSDELVVYFQPIVDVVGTRVRGAEALVRWEHPTRGLLAPGAFVEAVEQTGLIAPMTRLVMERAVEQCAQWRRDGRDLSVAVNLSVRNLLDRDLPNQVDRILSTYGLPPGALQLEITESMVMTDPERVLGTVARLNELGVRLSVDDFGTGYSSLANLRQMPIDELKIDRSFVSPMLKGESDLIIVRSTINLGHDLGLRVIAEGVEDEQTLARLARLGCDLAQGYHVSRPLPAAGFTEWLDEDVRPHLALAV